MTEKSCAKFSDTEDPFLVKTEADTVSFVCESLWLRSEVVEAVQNIDPKSKWKARSLLTNAITLGIANDNWGIQQF